MKLRVEFTEFAKEMNLYKKPQFDHNFNEIFEPLHDHITNLCMTTEYTVDNKTSMRIFKTIDNGGDNLLSVDEV